MKAIAYAKINLSLEVGPPRADGYHAYESHAMSVGISDNLSFSVVGEGERRVRTSMSSGLPDTLARRAVENVLDIADAELAIDVYIDKHIPHGAGLAGGSADAAASLIATAALVDAEDDDIDLLGLATELGTDVPFCLTGGYARLHGRGELVEPRVPPEPFGVLVAVPPLEVSTAAVFEAYDRVPSGPELEPVPGWLAELVPGCSFRNDLEHAAFEVEPELASWKAFIEDATGHTAHMTGSGSAYLSYAPDVDDFAGVVDTLRRAGVRAWATEPVPAGVRTIR